MHARGSARDLDRADGVGGLNGRIDTTSLPRKRRPAPSPRWCGTSARCAPARRSAAAIRLPAALPRTRTSSRDEGHQVVAPVALQVLDLLGERAIDEHPVARHVGADVEVLAQRGQARVPGRDMASSGQGLGLRSQKHGIVGVLARQDADVALHVPRRGLRYARYAAARIARRTSRGSFIAVKIPRCSSRPASSLRSCCRSTRTCRSTKPRTAHTCATSLRSRLSAITVNAHASEVASCTFDEQRRVLEISRERLKLPIVNGIYADGSLEAARRSLMAQGGASALLVFPPGIYTFGQRPEMALAHFRASPTRRTCRSSCSSIRSPAGRATAFHAREDPG